MRKAKNIALHRIMGEFKSASIKAMQNDARILPLEAIMEEA